MPKPSARLPWPRLIVGILGLVIVLTGGWYAYGENRAEFTPAGTMPAGVAQELETPEPTATPSVSASARPSTPVASPGITPSNLDIPAIKIDNPIVPVKVIDGELQIPPDPNVMGWWSGGAKPGSNRGAVVITAHLDARKYGAGVMVRLKDTPIGAQVSIAGKPGEKAVEYKVVARRSYVKADLPYAELFSRTISPQLVLITCGGPFNKSTRHYRDNIVVIATPVG
ncbi:MAG: class F sortase [Angustibacter sp.]